MHCRQFAVQADIEATSRIKVSIRGNGSGSNLEQAIRARRALTPVWLHIE